jgi:lipopolysaccharide/colanic/teichoic acid biosynthesis glycosyltransferase
VPAGSHPAGHYFFMGLEGRMQYLDIWSLVSDWEIIFRTILGVVTGKTANCLS